MVLRSCRENKASVLEQVRAGKIDAIALSSTNLVDDIILAMHTNGLLDCLGKGITDKRRHNTTVPYNVIWASAIAAKMKVHSSLTDIPYAISDHRVLAKLGYSLYDDSCGLGQSLMTEGSIRFLIGKYDADDLISGYNDTLQHHIMKKMDMIPDIHILDCTDLEVNFDNSNYEGAGLSYSKRTKDGTQTKARGYKLATLRGLVKDSGIIEEIRFGPINTHDLMLSKDMILTSPVLKNGDILINDRGFLSRDIINYLKAIRSIDSYVPLRSDMISYEIAVSLAKEQNLWINNPCKRYKNQKITLIEDLGPFWESDTKAHDLLDVPLNGCVIWDVVNSTYSVIVTTDTSQTAANIVKTYCLRPEIEEDYRQIKDFWRIEDFKSTKLNLIAFHIICVLFGYLFFQLYTLLPDGEKHYGKSLPVLLKRYQTKIHGFLIIYIGNEFGVFTLIEVLQIYSNAHQSIKIILEKEIKKVQEL